MIYAMVLKNVVVDIKKAETAPYYPPDIEGNPVSAIETTKETEVGMYYHEDTGNFDFEFPEPETEETQLDRIEGLLAQNVTDIENNAIDRYNLELVKEGVL